MAAMRPSMFENPEALANLAKLFPQADGVAAGASAGGHSRKEGRRTVASSAGKVSGAQRIGGSFTPTADLSLIHI